MKSSYHSIYLSPHLDDVALSCGGQVFLQTQRGESVLIVTIAAGEPRAEVRSAFVDFLHHNWGVTAEEALTRRRAEDIAACRVLGADFLHLSLPDCIYRVDPQSGRPLYTSDEDIFGPIDPVELPLVNEVADWLAQLPDAERTVAPLTVGHHVDHRLTRLAAEKQYGQALLYYEDYPYVQREPQALAPLASPPDWISETIPLSEAATAARLEATLNYQSQIKSLFNNSEMMVARQREYIQSVGGERIWRKRAD